MDVERSTFVIEETGRLTAVFRKVEPQEHVALVADALLI